MNKKGFTLIELIIVVIIIGILATLAVPQFLKATERAKIAKAKNALGLISKAEKMYYAVPTNEGGGQDSYTAVATPTINTTLGRFVELTDVDVDIDWGYATTSATAAGFVVQATRSSGNYAGCTITLDNVGNWVDGCSSQL